MDAKPEQLLLERGVEAHEAFLAVGNERFEGEGAGFIRNREVPAVRDANHVCQVRTEQIAALLARADEEFAGFPHRQFSLDPFTPRDVELRLVMEGYQVGAGLLVALEGPLLRPAKECDIRPALIHRCVVDCRGRGAREIVLIADPNDTPKLMYQALGFQPVALLREYWKAV